MSKNYIKYFAAGAVVVGALGYMFITTLNNDTIYYLEVSDLLTSKRAAEGRGIRLSGKVSANNYNIDKLGNSIFEITDGNTAITVAYSGAFPDMFESGATVILEGKYHLSDRLFKANSVLTPCHSTYEAADMSPEAVEKHLNNVI